MFPSSSSPSAAGMLRRILLDSTGIGPPPSHPDAEQTWSSSHHAEHIDRQLDEQSRIDGSNPWNSVIADDAMLSMSASPHADHHGGHAVHMDSDNDTSHELQLSPCELDDGDPNDEDEDETVLSMNMDPDHSVLGDNYASTIMARLGEQSGLLGDLVHPPRKKGRPSKFSLGGSAKTGAECTVCKKIFNNSSALAKHKLTHSSERKYICRLCGKTFKRQDHLNGHMLTHSSKKPFECRFPACGRSYCDARSLRRHHDNYHSRQSGDATSAANRPSSAEEFTVSSCPSVDQPSRLMAAVSTNSLSPGSESAREIGTISNSSDSSSIFESDLPYECELCGRRFKNLPALNGHMRLHGGYFKKDSVPTLSSGGRFIPVSESLVTNTSSSNAGPVLLAKTIDNQWTIPGLLLQSAGGSEATSLSLDQSAAAVAANGTMSFSAVANANVLPVVVPTCLSLFAGLSSNSLVTPASSTGLIHIDPAQLNLLLARNVVQIPAISASSSDAVFSKANTDVSDSVASNITKQTEVGSAGVAEKLEHRIWKYGSFSSHDYASAGSPAASEVVKGESKSNAGSLLLVTSGVGSGNSLAQLTVDTSNDPEALLHVFPHHVANQEATQNYPAIHKLLQHGVPEHDSTPKSKIRRLLTEENHTAFCSDDSYPSFQHWPVSNTDSLLVGQSYSKDGSDNTHSQDMLEVPFHQESVGFELMSQNPLTLLQEAAHALDSRSSKSMDDYHFVNESESKFSAPVVPGLYHKFIRKNRPEPLKIPSPVTHFGFQSRLRSPRILPDHTGPLAVTIPVQSSIGSGSSNVNGSSTFMPYTPPPMLSPLRAGSGLFSSLVQQSPKSAPVGLRLGLMRANSISSSGIIAQPPSTIIEEEEEDEDEEEVEDEQQDEVEELVDVPTIETEEVIHDLGLATPPQTDISPHINIGPEYQAEMPAYRAERSSAYGMPDFADIVWNPASVKHLTEEDVRHYLDFACCAAVHGSGTNKEYALHLLNLCRGNIKVAAMKLMQAEPQLPENHHLHNYKYAETVVWTTEEIEAYQQAMIKFDKDFFRVSQQVESKSVRECTEFYFLWKKVCVDEWRRMRIIRRKRLHDSYNLRSTNEPPKFTTGDQSCQDLQTGSDIQIYDQSDLNKALSQPSSPRPVQHGPAVVSGSVQTHGATTVATTQQLFPCRICGKVFDRVKSRSAHMKSHRQAEPDPRPRPSSLLY